MLWTYLIMRNQERYAGAHPDPGYPPRTLIAKRLETSTTSQAHNVNRGWGRQYLRAVSEIYFLLIILCPYCFKNYIQYNLFVGYGLFKNMYTLQKMFTSFSQQASKVLCRYSVFTLVIVPFLKETTIFLHNVETYDHKIDCINTPTNKTHLIRT